MADTICDLKSFSANSSPERVKTVTPGILVPEPFTFTAPGVERQGTTTPSASEAVSASIVKLVDIAHARHASANGSTVSLEHGNLVGRKLFSVSVYPKRSIELTTPPTWADIFAFVLLNLDLLLKPGHAFGSWLNRSWNTHVLDVVICVSDRRIAIELGQLFNQTSIYDLATQKEIVIGTAGNGLTDSSEEVLAQNSARLEPQ